ncbi:alpha-galactosidase [Anaerobacterium chartisolvens]|uniref:Alpha-galactosidase n=1 Tax=Anaerobacterium chartisolvens TaxID=1297424 RepID=A0A369AZB4_9FIRM|nr:glycoside hydrolase family 36 protein [Anaerobacterium chartisolvens]RCX14772.1 alpha-galactosidase [Anaerobacterium chartisolvens]
MSRILSEYIFGDISVRYLINEAGNVGIEILPASLKEKAVQDKKYNIDSLVQAYIKGDDFSGGFANGHTMRNGQSTSVLEYDSQRADYNNGTQIITTVLKNGNGHFARHILKYKEGLKAFEVNTIYSNKSDKAIDVEMLSSFSLGGLTPFIEGEAYESMNVHRIRSCWSNEGRLITESVEELQLEPSWSQHGVRSEKFGQIGSMPVRKYFPFVAVEDTITGVVWAAQLACASSWQMEVYRRDDALCVSGGLADFDFGHWMKTLQPGEELETPSAYLTVGRGSVDEAAQRLLTIPKDKFDKINKFERLPVLFNEFCTTWGYPSHDNIKKILDIIKGRGVDCFVIDAGWSADNENGWDTTVGDWVVSPDLFPQGLGETVKMIKDAGMLPGIWFEFENCCSKAKAYEDETHLLKRNGKVITSGVRRFWDMSDPFVVDYLTEKVICMLKQYGFKYLKVDYNETIGVGCDGYESLGEGLRQRVLASQAFFAKIREEVSDIIIENCSSGGHRLEPSMMALCDMASFSDAHECNEIPIIAANLHRVISPCQSQIWAVLRKTDSRKRIIYSIISTFLGVMCLSGDVYDLDKEQWDVIDEGISFYHSISDIILNGTTTFFGSKLKGYRNPKGWQGIVRKADNEKEAVVLIHTFNRDFPDSIEIPVGGSYEIHKTFCTFGNNISLKDGCLSVQMKEEFEAVAVCLKLRKY